MNVYAMLRYKFESNSQPEHGGEYLALNVYAMIDTSLKAIHNYILAISLARFNVYAMLRYKFESNSGSQRTQLQMYE